MNQQYPTDSSSLPASRPSPRQLQGPRPTPLKVHKDSHKISKKPPVVPKNPSNPPAPPPQPLIIYTVSPKIIHTNPSDFMSLVQRLTGPSSADPALPSSSPSASASGALSPAARFAAIEKENRPSPRKNSQNYQAAITEDDYENGGGNSMMLDRPTQSSMPGILSPLPSSLQPISASFFSPIASFDASSFTSLLSDLSPSPAFGNNFLTSPSNFMSPGSYWDLFGDL